jgi:hypothetical protein
MERLPIERGWRKAPDLGVSFAERLSPKNEVLASWSGAGALLHGLKDSKAERDNW